MLPSVMAVFVRHRWSSPRRLQNCTRNVRLRENRAAGAAMMMRAADARALTKPTGPYGSRGTSFAANIVTDSRPPCSIVNTAGLSSQASLTLPPANGWRDDGEHHTAWLPAPRAFKSTPEDSEVEPRTRCCRTENRRTEDGERGTRTWRRDRVKKTSFNSKHQCLQTMPAQ